MTTPAEEHSENVEVLDSWAIPFVDWLLTDTDLGMPLPTDSGGKDGEGGT